MDDVKSTLQKIKALADGTTFEHERNAALKKLDELMAKYGIAEHEFNDDAVSTYQFKYSNKRERKLLLQICAKVIAGKSLAAFEYRRRNRKALIIGLDCTAAQKIEIELYFDFYKQLYKREENIFFTAFINKHSLYAPPDETDENTVRTDDISKIIALMKGMSSESPVRKLTDNNA